jgi:CRP-like cAMP-binding protein
MSKTGQKRKKMTTSRQRSTDALRHAMPLSEGLASTVLEGCVTRVLPPQTPLQHVGDEPGGLWGLAEGAVAVEMAPGSRTPQKSFILQPPLWIGAGSLLSGRPRAVGLTTTRRSTVLLLPALRFRSLAEAHPELWRWVAIMEHGTSLIALAMADALMTREASDRVLAVLRCLCLHNAPRATAEGAAPPPQTVDLDLTQAELAVMANVSRSVLSPILQHLAAAGVLDLRRNRMRVTFAAGVGQGS